MKISVKSALIIFTAISMCIVCIGIWELASTELTIKNATKETEKRLTQADSANNQKQTTTSEETQNEEEPNSAEKSLNQKPSGFALLTFPSGKKVGVYDGLTYENLDFGAAYMQSSAAIGSAGNCVLFGHRNTAFKPLKDLMEGDILTLNTAEEEFKYTIVSLKITYPEDETITEQHSEPTLTLVTCYPFVFGSDSSQRYVIVAK